MNFSFSKLDKYQWTQHSLYKMRQYGLSPQRIIRVIRNPERIEVGIVENTIAVMQPASVKYKNFRKTWNQEIWVMYQTGRAVNPKSEYQKPKPVENNETKNPKQSQITKLKTNKTKKLKIISAWRYPGISPKNNPIPKEILKELKSLI